MTLYFGRVHALSSNFQNKCAQNILLCFYHTFWQPVIGFCFAWLPLHGGIIDGSFFHVALLDICLNDTHKQMMVMIVAITIATITVIIIFSSPAAFSQVTFLWFFSSCPCTVSPFFFKSILIIKLPYFAFSSFILFESLYVKSVFVKS